MFCCNRFIEVYITHDQLQIPKVYGKFWCVLHTQPASRTYLHLLKFPRPLGGPRLPTPPASPALHCGPRQPLTCSLPLQVTLSTTWLKWCYTISAIFGLASFIYSAQLFWDAALFAGHISHSFLSIAEQNFIVWGYTHPFARWWAFGLLPVWGYSE